MDKKYRKMLRRMREKRAGAAESAPKESWFLYVVHCGDGSYYTGITRDVGGRLRKHNDGKGSAYTRSHRPVRLVYQEACADRSSALVRECQVKSLPRASKAKLVSAASSG